MTLRLLQCLPHGPQPQQSHRPKLTKDKVYCHRCSGFGRTAKDLDSRGCIVCDGTGILNRERFGVHNPEKHWPDGNAFTSYVNGVDAQGRTHLAKTGIQQEESWGSGSVFETPVAISASNHAEGSAIECRMPVALPEGQAAPTSVMVMPGGLHEITAGQNGKPVRVQVQVGPDTAKVLDASLRAHLAAGPQRPFFDFNHDGKAASAWPTAFEWRQSPTPGVYAMVEWSRSGADAVTGKEYRAFSPKFHVDSVSSRPAKVVGAPLNMGGLVNDPAFKEISPIWASDRSSEGTEVVNMEPKELAELQAAKQKLEKENAELRAQQAGSDNATAIAAKNEEIKQLNQALEKVQGEIKARNKAAAKAAVETAVARGALPPKDTAIQASWMQMIEENPERATMLAALPSNPALAPVTAASTANAGGALQASGVQITREDSQRVLLAYAQEADPKKRGAIYASEISPRINKREDFPLVLRPDFAVQAANSLGTLQVDIVSQRALETLVHTFPMLSKISRNFSSEIVSFGQSVKTRTVGIPAVGTYDTNNGYVSGAATTTDVSVPLNQHKFVQIEATVEELASTTRDLFGEQSVAINYAMGEDLMAALYANITVANFAKATNETVVSLASWSRKGVMALGRKLTGRKVPGVMRFLLLSGAYYDKLGEDTVVVSAFNNPNAGDTVQSGELPDVHGFAVGDAKTLPTAENLQGFAMFPSALCLASRIPDDYTKVFPGVTGGAVTRVITDPTTGLSLLLVQFVNHNLGRAFWRVAWMYGTAPGDKRAGERLCDAATP